MEMGKERFWCYYITFWIEHYPIVKVYLFFVSHFFFLGSWVHLFDDHFYFSRNTHHGLGHGVSYIEQNVPRRDLSEQTEASSFSKLLHKLVFQKSLPRSRTQNQKPIIQFELLTLPTPGLRSTSHMLISHYQKVEYIDFSLGWGGLGLQKPAISANYTPQCFSPH